MVGSIQWRVVPNPKTWKEHLMDWSMATLITLAIVMVVCCVLPMLFMRRHSTRDHNRRGKDAGR